MKGTRTVAPLLVLYAVFSTGCGENATTENSSADAGGLDASVRVESSLPYDSETGAGESGPVDAGVPETADGGRLDASADSDSGAEDATDGGGDDSRLPESGYVDASDATVDAFVDASDATADGHVDASDAALADGSPESGAADAPCVSTGPTLLRRDEVDGGTTAPVFAQGINGSGQIVGAVRVPSLGLAGAFWATPTSSVTTIPSGSFGQDIAALGINSSGEIVGAAGYESGSEVPLFWSSPTAVPVALSLGGFTTATAYGINNHGEIVGTADTFNAVYWATPASPPTALPRGTFVPPSGDEQVLAFGINDASQIVGAGYSHTTSGIERPALLWSNLTSDPVTLPSGSAGYASASGVNNLGVIVGTDTSAIVWTSATSPPIPLPSAPFAGAAAYGTNDRGEVVGESLGQVLPEGGVTRPGGALYWTTCH